MSSRKSRPLFKKLTPSLTSCTISIFYWLCFCTLFKRFCKGVHFFKMAVYFLIVLRWLRLVTDRNNFVYDHSLLPYFDVSRNINSLCTKFLQLYLLTFISVNAWKYKKTGRLEVGKRLKVFIECLITSFEKV